MNVWQRARCVGVNGGAVGWAMILGSLGGCGDGAGAAQQGGQQVGEEIHTPQAESNGLGGVSHEDPVVEHGAVSDDDGIDDGERERTNLLADGSFESGESGEWFDFAARSPVWVGFEVVEGAGIDGGHGARLMMDSSDPEQPAVTAIHGVVQEVRRDRALEVPGYVSGWYRVGQWERGAEKQYVQVVVMAERPVNGPVGSNFPTYQVAMVLMGVDEPPLSLGNRKFVFDDNEMPAMEPVIDEWVWFEFDLRAIYEEYWGFVPVSSGYRVFFEVRYDGRDDGVDERAVGEVDFDDVYFGADGG